MLFLRFDLNLMMLNFQITKFLLQTAVFKKKLISFILYNTCWAVMGEDL